MARGYKVALLRLCGPATWELPPFCDMPRALVETIRGHDAMLPGGFEYDGRVIVPLDEDAVRAAGRE